MFRRWVQRRPEGEAPAANMQHRYKGKLDAAANDVQTATKKLADDLKALGKPDTESGQEVKNSIDKLSASLQNNVSKIETATKNASGISGLASAAVTASGCDDGDAAALTSTLQTIDNASVKGDLKNSFDQAGACKGVTR